MKLKSSPSKRPLTLLEVLIAMAIVMLCALPLLSPHAAMYKEQKKLIAKIKEDHQAQVQFVDFYEKLLRGEETVENLKVIKEKKLAKLYEYKIGNYTYTIAVKKESSDPD